VPEGIDLLAGVDLSTPALVLGDITDLSGAVYDPATRQLVLLGQKKVGLPAFRLDDLAVSLKAAARVASGDPAARTPGVSIEGPIVQDLMTVKYLGDTANTHFGAVMFEADRLMKCLSMGRDNLTGKPLRSKVPGYKSELDLLHELGGTRRPNAWHRYWFRPGRIVVEEALDGTALSFRDVTVEVQTEYVPPLAPGQSEPAAEAFAKHMSDHFAEYAQEFPVFAELLSLAKMQGLVNWLVEKRVPIDATGLLAVPVPQVATPKTTPINFVESQHVVPQGILKHQMRGGVDLRIQRHGLVGGVKQNWYATTSGTVTYLSERVMEGRKGRSNRWQVSLDGGPRVAVGLSTQALRQAVEVAKATPPSGVPTPASAPASGG
jgi:hypothetical protein